MNEIVNKFLLAENTLKWNAIKTTWIYINSACGPFTKNKNKKKQKNTKIKKKTGDSWYIYQNKLDKACFQHGMD